MLVSLVSNIHFHYKEKSNFEEKCNINIRHSANFIIYYYVPSFSLSSLFSLQFGFFHFLAHSSVLQLHRCARVYFAIP